MNGERPADSREIRELLVVDGSLRLSQPRFEDRFDGRVEMLKVAKSFQAFPNAERRFLVAVELNEPSIAADDVPASVDDLVALLVASFDRSAEWGSHV